MNETLVLARRYIDLDRPESALEVLERARGEDLENAEFWAIRAQSLLQLERLSESAEAAEKGLERDPEDVELLDLLALAHLQADRYGDASRVLTKALELAPDEPILLAHKALASAHLGSFEVARELIARAMRVAPDSVPVLRARAQVAYLANEGRASDYVDELLEADPEDSVGHALRGNLAIRRKDYRSASQAFDEVARLDPSDREVADVAGRTRVAAHPLLAPVRPMWRFGRWRTYFVYLTLVFVLAAAGLQSVRYVVIAVWVCIVLLSRLGPRFLLWRRKRKYGGF